MDTIYIFNYIYILLQVVQANMNVWYFLIKLFEEERERKEECKLEISKNLNLSREFEEEEGTKKGKKK